jgi:hypothetical protein
LIIEGNGALASQYATKIMEIYNQYQWRASQHETSEGPRWRGWQITINGRSEYRMRMRVPKPTTIAGGVSLISGSASRDASYDI